MSETRVLVVDDQQLVRDGIASLLGIQPGIVVAGVAGDGEDAVTKAVELQPDVVLMDVRMPEVDGVEATRELLRRLPGCRVVMLTTFDDDDYVAEALRAGAIGYLLKDLAAEELAHAIRLAHRGVAQFDASVARRLAAGLPAPSASADGLSGRELEILRLVSQGRTNREIGTRMHLSEGTVKNHISRILGRLHLRDRTQAALYARDRGLL
ncbi:response regulator transcription factor [Dactylosporangium sp. AC04546]|uniref:response regulator n=1 Tax=Dactylosporangium sp. AC04546 TaxID=2862460 RepID=UPI001EDF8CB3|nr:response regulator transcription factor [Dactylosporangium sp. AC04546]WVK89248.1 response regulator transcription factor [Dactylosporangium sp. AC04546]